jgi:hypothetical protein
MLGRALKEVASIMKIWKSKVWPPLDVVLLKWTCVFVGAIVGAFIPTFVRDHLWLFVIAAVLLAIRPTVSYFRDDLKAKG